jgi:hypothetical protein
MGLGVPLLVSTTGACRYRIEAVEVHISIGHQVGSPSPFTSATYTEVTEVVLLVPTAPVAEARPAADYRCRTRLPARR